jgi:hypothetical protein
MLWWTTGQKKQQNLFRFAERPALNWCLHTFLSLQPHRQTGRQPGHSSQSENLSTPHRSFPPTATNPTGLDPVARGFPRYDFTLDFILVTL